MNLQTEQLEILLAEANAPAAGRSGSKTGGRSRLVRRHTSRARWWFSQMRRAVDEAVEEAAAWGKPAPGRANQQCLPLPGTLRTNPWS